MVGQRAILINGKSTLFFGTNTELEARSPIGGSYPTIKI